MNGSKSIENLRRSQRIIEKKSTGKAKSEGKIAAGDTQDVQKVSSGAVSKKNSSLSSQASRVRKLEIENAIKKKTLEKEELKRQQELLDLELALKLAEIGEESEEGESMSMHESQRPNVEEWVYGNTPWDYRCDKREDKHSILTTKGDELVRESFSRNKQEMYSTSQIDDAPCQMTFPQMTKILTRQSLPRDLPIFDGNPVDWPNFIYHYNNSNTICGYSNEENQSRLQKCLKGNAKRIVQSLLIMPQNVAKVIALLKTRFGRPDHIIMILLDKIKKFPQIEEDKLELFIEFSDEIKNFVATIESLEEEDHLHNTILLNEILSKLPTSYQLSWVEHLSQICKPQYKLVEFVNWLDGKANAACQIHIPKFDTRNDNVNQQNSKFKNVKKAVTLATSKNACLCCKGDIHHLTECSKFQSLTVDDRWSFITENKICFSCLFPFHNIKQCRKRKVCGINECKRSHHQLLHKDPLQKYENSKISDDTAVVGTNSHSSKNNTVLLKIVPVVVAYGNKKSETFALLDDASTISLIDDDFANSLNMTGPIQSLSLQWTNDDLVHQQNDSRIVSFTIRARDNGSSFQLRHIRTTKLSLPSQTIDIDEIKRRYPYVNDNIVSMKSAQPQILIGQDNWPLLVNRRLITGPWSGPAVSKTLLGWVLHGNLNNSTKNQHFVCHIHSQYDEKEKDDLDILHDMVKEHWKMESVQGASDKVMSIEDRRAQLILDTTMKRIGDRYETGLLWKTDNTILPESRINALKRLRYTEQRMDRNMVYGESYCNKFRDMEEKEYIKKLTKEEADKVNDRTWYLPHFGVTNVHKPNKLRIVFDASAKSHGVSLNHHLLTGPDLYNSLNTILLNFRIEKYAFKADIKEMFLQVKVRAEDCCAQRILWRGMDRNVEPDVYEIVVVFFGSTCGPCLAQEAKNRNANDFKDRFPEATNAIVNQHYMDDYLGSADTAEEARKLIEEVVYVHKAGGFVICNWTANEKEILRSLDANLLAAGGEEWKENGESESAMERILGVFWNPYMRTYSVSEQNFKKLIKIFWKTDEDLQKGKF